MTFVTTRLETSEETALRRLAAALGVDENDVGGDLLAALGRLELAVADRAPSKEKVIVTFVGEGEFAGLCSAEAAAWIAPKEWGELFELTGDYLCDDMSIPGALIERVRRWEERSTALDGALVTLGWLYSDGGEVPPDLSVRLRSLANKAAVLDAILDRLDIDDAQRADGVAPVNFVERVVAWQGRSRRLDAFLEEMEAGSGI